MNCKDFQDIVDSYLSDELLTETNHEIMRHMESCSDCRSVIEARREIRGLLKTAVKAAPEYRLDEGFDHKIMTLLRHEADQKNESLWFSIFGARAIATAAALAIVGLIGYGVISNLGGMDSSQYLVSGFAEDSLVNIASGDHQNCAVKYDLEEHPVPLSEADSQYQGLDALIRSKIKGELAGHKLVEAHACKFKNVSFAHFVLSAPDDLISVLVAPTGKETGDIEAKISGFSSKAYEISQFDVEKNSVFVISGKGKALNRKTAEALVKPFEQHFNIRNGVQTAMLTAHYPRR